MNRRSKHFDLVLTAFFLAILLLFASVPFLGFIPLGPINATTMHIPVIIASIVLGPRLGGFLGGCFGIISMIRSTVIVTPLSFVFSPFVAPIGAEHGSIQSVIIALIPRILIGIVPYYVYRALLKLTKQRYQPVLLFIAGTLGGLTNTILVMNGIYFLFQAQYAQLIGKSGSAVYTAINGIILTQGIPEALVAGIATSAIATVLLKLYQRKQ